MSGSRGLPGARKGGDPRTGRAPDALRPGQRAAGHPRTGRCTGLLASSVHRRKLLRAVDTSSPSQGGAGAAGAAPGGGAGWAWASVAFPGEVPDPCAQGCFLSRLSTASCRFHYLGPVTLVLISISSFYCHCKRTHFHFLVLITRVEKALFKKNVPCIQSFSHCTCLL